MCRGDGRGKGIMENDSQVSGLADTCYSTAVRHNGWVDFPSAGVFLGRQSQDDMAIMAETGLVRSAFFLQGMKRMLRGREAVQMERTSVQRSRVGGLASQL